LGSPAAADSRTGRGLACLVRTTVGAAGTQVLPNWRSLGDCLAGCALPPASDGPRVLGLVGGATDAAAMRETLRKETAISRKTPTSCTSFETQDAGRRTQDEPIT